jgi:putative ATP-binding cassette transporter
MGSFKDSAAAPAPEGADPLAMPAHDGHGGTVFAELKAFARVLWTPPARERLTFLVLTIVMVILFTVVGQLRLNSWYKDFYNAIEQRSISSFAVQLLVFGGIICGLLVLNVGQTWLNLMIKMRAREQLTRDLVGQWLVPKRDVMFAGSGPIGLNPDQRIHADAQHLSDLSADLSIGLLQAFLLLVSFISVLWILSSGVVFHFGGHDFSIPGYMVWWAVLYAAVGSFLSWVVGRRLVPLNVERYAREANLRFALVRANENLDGISLYNGEPNERHRLNGEVDNVIAILRRIVGATTRLTWVTAGYGWVAIVIPILAAAPGYFEGRLSFGDLMMVAGAFNQVQQSLRWFVDNFGGIADWRATLRRVMGFRDALMTLTGTEGDGPRIEFGDSPSDALVLENLVVKLNDGTSALDTPRVEVKPGEHLLIIGRQDSGKSSAFRAIGGLWPWGSGRILIPHGARMAFLPQRPYVPPGTLRSTLCYPVVPSSPDDSALVAAMERVGLAKLVPQLDEARRWDKDLTLGTQQRLAIARLLLVKPDIILLDEVFDVLEDDDRKLVFSLLSNELRHAAVISFGRHRAHNGDFPRIVHLNRLTHTGVGIEDAPATPSSPAPGADPVIVGADG